MSKKDAKIGCPTFQKQEPTILDITAGINSARDILEKAECAQKLQEEVDSLLSCADYDENIVDCRNCRLISTVRSKTAHLVIKAKELA
jgi:hypothetical protein